MSGTSASGIEAFQAQLRATLEPALVSWLARTRADASQGGEHLEAIRAAVVSLVERGGKRVRAALVALGYSGSSGAPLDDALEATLGAQIAMELLQAYLLIHDDWIDQDDVRRGGPTAHVALAAAYGTKALGDACAVLAGDYASSLAQRAFLECHVPPERLVVAARAFAKMQERVVLGQGMDVLAVLRQEPLGERAAVEAVHEYKTASYTVTGPLVVGAALAGAEDSLLEQLSAFGRLAGIAFQLRDDLLGTFGDAAVTGKEALSDLRHGKRTALLAELPQSGISKELCMRIVRGEANDQELATARRALETSGAKDRVEARIQVLVKEAWNIGRELPWNGTSRDLLREVLVSLTDRTR